MARRVRTERARKRKRILARGYIASCAAPVKRPADTIIEGLGGDPRSGMCCCPAHDDQEPSLRVSDVNGKVLLYCFAGCSQSAVLDALKARGLWPVPGTVSAPTTTPRWHSDNQRRDFALKILADTERNRGRELAEFLDVYFSCRGIKTVPPTAMLALPHITDARIEGLVLPDEPAMIFAVTDGDKIVGAHVTWLNSDLTAKRDEEPKRQFFGPIGGGYIKLYAGELEPTSKLIIAEGIETAMAAAQMAEGLLAIAALSATNLPKINPPPAAEYIVAADHDTAGLKSAWALVHKLVRAGNLARIAIPPTHGNDWNDELRKM